MTEESYEIYAIKYARLMRRSPENFIGGDAHDTEMPLNYYVWVVSNKERSIVVDTGFNETMAKKRNRQIVRPVAEGIKALGIEPEKVKDVIITHMHYDHAGNIPLFANARYHLQDKEMQYATGRHMGQPVFRGAFDVEDVVGMVRNTYAGRVKFHDGDATIAPGVSLHFIGGHTMGLQVVRVATRRGWVVLASDASHFYANMEQQRPFPIVYNLADMVEGYARLRALADSPAHIIPGHDPQVLARYPAPEKALQGIAARLD
jgi:glyoxylase-like metal-dependent hydrolase (beta-lactamase superfamily II)